MGSHEGNPEALYAEADLFSRTQGKDSRAHTRRCSPSSLWLPTVQKRNAGFHTGKNERVVSVSLRVPTCEVEDGVEDPNSGLEGRLEVVLVHVGIRASLEHRLAALQGPAQGLGGNPEQVRRTVSRKRDSRCKTEENRHF